MEKILHEMFSPDDKKIAISHFLLLDDLKKQDYWRVKNRKNLKKILQLLVEKLESKPNCNHRLQKRQPKVTSTTGCKNSNQW